MSTNLWSIGPGDPVAGIDMPDFPFTEEAKPMMGRVQARLLSAGLLLEWESIPNKVYEVQSAKELAEAPAWSGRDRDVYSQGTNTIWLDREWQNHNGGEILSSQLFYRVLVRSNSISPPTLSITVPDGPMSGTVSIAVQCTTEPTLMNAQVFVDGGPYDDLELNRDGSPGDTILFDTTQVANGPHSLWVMAYNESGYEMTGLGSRLNTGYAITPRYSVLISNAPAAGPKPAAAGDSTGIMYQKHHPSPRSDPDHDWDPPRNGINAYVPLLSPAKRPYGSIGALEKIANEFSSGLAHHGYPQRFLLVDDDVVGASIRDQQFGGRNQFNSVNFGFLLGHGNAGTDFDYTTGLPGVLDTYYPVWTKGTRAYDWVRISECNFGSEKLRWMAILSCNNLSPANVNDLWDKEFINGLILNENLHCLLGTGSSVIMVSNFGKTFAKFCGDGLPVIDAWFAAGKVSQSDPKASPRFAVDFTAVYWPSCRTDTIYEWSDPDTTDLPEIETRRVYQP